MNISDIYEGWRNHLFPPHKIVNIIKSISRSRRRICDGCAYNSKFLEGFKWRPDIYCTLCGCTLSAKTKCLSCECPDNPPRWKAVLTEEQEEEILNEKNS